jgi:hypothetical protein
LWWSVEHRSFVWPGLGFSFGACSIGLWRQSAWAKNAVTIVLIGLIAIWVAVSVYYIALGFWPYETTQLTVLSLIPGAIFVLLNVGVIVLVRRAFRADQTGT